MGDYDNMYPPGKGPDDYLQDDYHPGKRDLYIEGNRARLVPWAEYAHPEIAVGWELIRAMPTRLLWALQSRWMTDLDVGWKARQRHWDKLIKFWVSAIPEAVVARHIKLIMPDAVVQTEEKTFAPCPAAHRQYVDKYDLRVTRNGVAKNYEVKKTNGHFSMTEHGNYGPQPGWLWVAKKEQVDDKLKTTEAWIWLNGKMTFMRMIKTSTFSQWKQEIYIPSPNETWYSAPHELWDYKVVRR